jgi:hypothetical protein
MFFRGYIRRGSEVDGGCRGGIATATAEYGDYAIEIGKDCYCQAEPAVVAGYAKEIIEFLETTKSPLGRLLLNNIRLGIEEFENQLKQKAPNQ